MNLAVNLGVISDTHGVLEPEVERAYRSGNLERILHAGDIGGPEVIRRLSAIAEVVAVAGNSDAPPFVNYFPTRACLTVAGCKILIIHDLGKEDLPEPAVLAWVRTERPRVVVFGHLHRPVRVHRDGILYFNPGSAGLSRNDEPRSFGFLRIEAGEPAALVEELKD